MYSVPTEGNTNISEENKLKQPKPTKATESRIITQALPFFNPRLMARKHPRVRLNASAS